MAYNQVSSTGEVAWQRTRGRAASESWTVIGAALSTPRQAAYQRFGHVTNKGRRPA